MSFKAVPDSGLYTDLYQLTMGQGYFKSGLHKKQASFDYFFRKAPFSGEYVIFAGLSDLLETLESLVFRADDISWLQGEGFDPDFCRFLSDYSFDGTVISVREGDVVFPGEPILTVNGPLFSCQIAETLLLNTLNFQSLIATKARRVRMACGEKKLIDFGLRRAQGTGSLSASRAAAIGGIDATSNTLAARMYNLPASGTMAHSWIQCFENERDAFMTYAKWYPDTTILLVDTYNTLKSGIPNAIKVAKELESRGHRMLGIRLDSGDPLSLSRAARSMLDEAGLHYVRIAVSDQLDEMRIQELSKQEAPIDIFGVGTRLVTGHPDGALGGVYKICELDGRPTMKQTDDLFKNSLPGKKEIFRESRSNGQFLRDHIVLNDNMQAGKQAEQIRSTVMDKGIVTGELPSVKEIAQYSNKRFEFVPEDVKRLSDPDCYELCIDEKLVELMEKLAKFVQE